MNNGQLAQKMGLPMEAKLSITRRRIKEWYDYHGGRVYVSFSGGKDSTFLLHVVREMYPDVVAVFFDTGLEFCNIRKFVAGIPNVITIKPKMKFSEVIKKYGYPLISKEQAKYIKEVQQGTTKYTESKRRGGKIGRNGRTVGAVSKKWRYLMDQKDIKISEKCCDIMKKGPAHKYEKESGNFPILGTMIEDSMLRRQSYQRNGCNAFEMKHPQSRPLSIWKTCDVWEYIRKNNVPYCDIYDNGYDRTGCMFCMFGVHRDGFPNRFQRMQLTHPKQWEYCINDLGCGKALDLIGVEYRYPRLLREMNKLKGAIK